MFSQTVEYALRAMVALASGDAKPETAEALASRTQVPQGYLSKIMRDMVVAGLVDSQRGPRGGFTLAKDPGSVSILDIIAAVEPLQRIKGCPLNNPLHVNLCPLHRRLDDAIAMIETAFRRSTLAEVVSESGAKRQCQTLSATALTTTGAKRVPPGQTRAG